MSRKYLWKNERLYVCNSKYYIDVRVFDSSDAIREHIESIWPGESFVKWSGLGCHIKVLGKRWHKGDVCIVQGCAPGVVIHELYHAAFWVADRIRSKFQMACDFPDESEYYNNKNKKEEFTASVLEEFFDNYLLECLTETC